ncbi:MAG: hypothetical protein GY822_05805 [Deltaproteobacteria bacterium]|nr:hypothetical protein [Deltaproteobacteria bacterium]
MSRSNDSRRQRRGQTLAEQADSALAQATEELDDATKKLDTPHPDTISKISSASSPASTLATPENSKHFDDDELASFMSADIQEGRRVRKIEPVRVILSIAVVLVLTIALRPLVEELRYHFNDAALVHLGDAPDLPMDPPLPINAYVSIHGVLGNKAATVSGLRPGSMRRGPVQVRQLLGSHVYVEFDQEKYKKKFNQFSEVSVAGRLADFGPNSELTAVRNYLINTQGLRIPDHARLLVVDEIPGEMLRYPIAFLLAILMATSSLFFMIRSFRTRVVDEDAIEDGIG